MTATVTPVTHDIDEALRLADRIVLIGPGGTVRAEFADLGGVDQRELLRERIIDRYRDASVRV